MISIIYITSRKNPQFQWFADSLYNQIYSVSKPEIEVIIVDHWKGDIGRFDYIRGAVDYRFEYTHVSPKPNAWNGPFRVTKEDYFTAASVRNTGVCYAKGDYVVFVDDLSVLSPTWFQSVLKAYFGGYIVAGAYKKSFELKVESGVIIHERQHPGGWDSRINFGSKWIDGGHLFGCSFGMPMNVYLEMNGQDEMCDPIGGEDYNLGIRLQRAGYKIFYDTEMFTTESEEWHGQPPIMKRIDKKIPQEEYMKKLASYGINQRYIPGNWDSSHLVLDILYGSNDNWTKGNDYNLSEMRNSILMGGGFPIPSKLASHWVDNQPLSEL